MRGRLSGSGREALLSVTLLALPGLLVLLLLSLSARRIPVNSLRLISEEGVTIYFNTATVRNVDVLFSGEQPGWQERIRVADYLMQPVLVRLGIQSGVIRSGMSRLSAFFLDGVLMPVQIRDLALLLGEGSTATHTAGGTPARTLERTGLDRKSVV